MRPDEMDAARLWERSGASRSSARPRNVSRAFQDAHPDIPWRQIIGLRNVLAHEYGEIRHELIFRITTNQIPALISLLEPLIPPPPE